MNSSKFGMKKKFLAAIGTAGMVLSLTTIVAPAKAAKTTLVVGSVQAYPQLNPIILQYPIHLLKKLHTRYQNLMCKMLMIQV